MRMGSAKSACRQIRTLYALGTLGSMTDAQLLALFLARGGDEAEDAFSALVDRHGPLVLAVCRRMLKSTHDAEDAFQATFFILARRAASLTRREKLAGWLHGVAVRTASEARRRSARQRRRERRSIEMSNTQSTPSNDQDDILPILDEELLRLPQRFRAALVACELEGKSRRQAALELGLPEGTLSTHLARARKLLRERLLRRKVSLGSGPALAMIPPLALSTIPERLKLATLKASLDVASSGAAGPAAFLLGHDSAGDIHFRRSHGTDRRSHRRTGRGCLPEPDLGFRTTLRISRPSRGGIVSNAVREDCNRSQRRLVSVGRVAAGPV